MNTLIPEDAISAVNVSYKNDAIRIELDNGRMVTAPLDFLPLIKKNVSKKDLQAMTLIDGGTGVMFGDGEAVSIITIMGFDCGYHVCKSWRENNHSERSLGLA